MVIKSLPRNSIETEIALFLSSGENAQGCKNHCVPVLDVIREETKRPRDFLLLPLLRPFDDPPFFSVEEVLDFMKQTLQVRP